jgi:hypothetical protein
VYSSRE